MVDILVSSVMNQLECQIKCKSPAPWRPRAHAGFRSKKKPIVQPSRYDDEKASVKFSVFNRTAELRFEEAADLLESLICWLAMWRNCREEDAKRLINAPKGVVRYSVNTKRSTNCSIPQGSRPQKALLPLIRVTLHSRCRRRCISLAGFCFTSALGQIPLKY